MFGSFQRFTAAAAAVAAAAKWWRPAANDDDDSHPKIVPGEAKRVRRWPALARNRPKTTHHVHAE